MNLFIKQKQTHRLKEQIYGCWLGRMGGEVIVREFGMNIYTLLYFKWITKRDLLYNTGNSVQCYMVAWMGENGCMYTCGWVPLVSSWKYQNIVNWLYPIKNKKFKKIWCILVVVLAHEPAPEHSSISSHTSCWLHDNRLGISEKPSFENGRTAAVFGPQWVHGVEHKTFSAKLKLQSWIAFLYPWLSLIHYTSNVSNPLHPIKNKI